MKLILIGLLLSFLSTPVICQFSIKIPSHLRAEMVNMPNDSRIEAIPVDNDPNCWEYTFYCVDENNNRVNLISWYAEPLFVLEKVSEYQSSNAYTKKESKKIKKRLRSVGIN